MSAFSWSLAIDLVGFNRKRTSSPMREATILEHASGCCCRSVSTCLSGKRKAPEAALDFFTGYVIEYSLSVDNIFVFVLIFTYFQVRRKSRSIAFWSGASFGALLMRGIMIWLGVSLVRAVPLDSLHFRCLSRHHRHPDAGEPRGRDRSREQLRPANVPPMDARDARSITARSSS